MAFQNKKQTVSNSLGVWSNLLNMQKSSKKTRVLGLLGVPCSCQTTLCAINYHVVPYHKLPRPPLKKRVFVGVITLARRGVFPKTLDQWKAHTTQKKMSIYTFWPFHLPVKIFGPQKCTFFQAKKAWFLAKVPLVLRVFSRVYNGGLGWFFFGLKHHSIGFVLSH